MFGKLIILGPKLLFAECDKHYPSRSGQNSLARAVINITKPGTKNKFGLSRVGYPGEEGTSALGRAFRVRLHE